MKFIYLASLLLLSNTIFAEELNISTANKDIYAKSKSLLANLNKRDRDLVKSELDLNQQIDTLN